MPTLSQPRDDIEPERLAEEDAFAPEMQAWFAAQAERIAQRARWGDEPDRDFWNEEEALLLAFLAAWLLRWSEAAIAEQVVTVITPAGLGLDAAVNARAAAWANSHALELAKGLTETTSELARQRIANWLTGGTGDLDTLRKSLGEIIAPQWRADMIAQTEVTRAWQVARQEIANEIDSVTWVFWSTAQDERVCNICGPMHGKRRRKTDSSYPNGQAPPPAHPRCRCGEYY